MKRSLFVRSYLRLNRMSGVICPHGIGLTMLNFRVPNSTFYFGIMSKRPRYTVIVAQFHIGSDATNYLFL